MTSSAVSEMIVDGGGYLYTLVSNVFVLTWLCELNSSQSTLTTPTKLHSNCPVSAVWKDKRRSFGKMYRITGLVPSVACDELQSLTLLVP